MSRVYFHGRTGDAELRGSERAWLSHLASGPAQLAWDLDRPFDHLERITEILAMVPEVPDGEYGSNYLHTYLREAQKQEQRNDAIYKGIPAGAPLGTYGADHGPERRLIAAFKTRLRTDGVKLEIAGHRLYSSSVELNTALVAGSDPIRLAAKIHGWCEVHAWVEGEDREWMAEIMDEGLNAGLYRANQGWEEVQAFLRLRNDEPVVMSYSVCDSFPNADVANFPPPWPEGVPRVWDDLTQEQQDEREQAYEAWGQLPDAEQWDLAMEGLRAREGSVQISPDTLATSGFGPLVTVYDLFAPDRDERIQAAFAADLEDSKKGC